MVHSILERVRPEDLRTHPYPCAVVHEALPKEYYAHLAATFPSLEQVAPSGRLPSNKAYRRPTLDVVASESIDPAWREFFAYHSSAEFFAEVRALWGDLIERIYPDIPTSFGKPLAEFGVESRWPGAHHREDSCESDITLDTQFVMNSPVRKRSSVRGIHVDRGLKLFNATLYFRLPEDDAKGGDLEIYEFADPRFRFDPSRPVDYRFVEHSPYSKLEVVPAEWVRLVETVPYGQNVMFLWLNTPYSLHGVSPREVSGLPRRYVNFLGECFNGPEHGFFIVPPGNPPWRKAFNRRVRAVKRFFGRRGGKPAEAERHPPST